MMQRCSQPVPIDGLAGLHEVSGVNGPEGAERNLDRTCGAFTSDDDATSRHKRLVMRPNYAIRAIHSHVTGTANLFGQRAPVFQGDDVT